MADEKWEQQAQTILHLAGSDPSGYLGRLTATEQQTLDEFRNKVNQAHQGHGWTDADLLRYLRAREFNLQKSLKMITNSFAWFEKVKPESTELKDCRAVYDNGSALPFGHDKTGRAAMWFFTKNHDPKLGGAAIQNAFFMMSHCLTKLPPEHECFAVIFDLEGYALKNADLTWCWNVINSLQNHYPERMGMCLLLNPPTVFWLLWKVVKPWLAQRTVSKIIFVDGDAKKKLKSLFNDDQIPSLLGGTGAVTPQSFIQDLCGPPPPAAAKKKGWFSWSRSGKNDQSAVVLDAPPPAEALGEEGQKLQQLSQAAAGSEEPQALN